MTFCNNVLVIFYILTKGKHPYAPGEKYVESKIAKNEPDLSAVSISIQLFTTGIANWLEIT